MTCHFPGQQYDRRATAAITHGHLSVWKHNHFDVGSGPLFWKPNTEIRQGDPIRIGMGLRIACLEIGSSIECVVDASNIGTEKNVWSIVVHFTRRRRMYASGWMYFESGTWTMVVATVLSAGSRKERKKECNQLRGYGLPLEALWDLTAYTLKAAIKNENTNCIGTSVSAEPIVMQSATVSSL